MSVLHTESSGPTAVQVNRVTAYMAFAWVMVFIAWHVVWAFTGLPSPDPSDHHGTARIVATVFEIVVLIMTAVGVAVPLALVQEWGRRIPRWMLVTALWIGFALLIVRGVSGVADSIGRATGVLPHGLTGMTTEEVNNTAHPSLWTRIAGHVTDGLFTVGGLVFGAAVLAFRRARPAVRRGQRTS
ncbi:DUF3995 domain-containing protein [Spirillospora sp. NPDC052269]